MVGGMVGGGQIDGWWILEMTLKLVTHSINASAGLVGMQLDSLSFELPQMLILYLSFEHTAFDGEG